MAGAGGIGIGSNIGSLAAQRQLAASSALMSKELTRLSSGLRINTSSDDAAGLAIASQLKASSKIYGQASRNLNDGISAANIAQGALAELSSITMANRNWRNRRPTASTAAPSGWRFRGRRTAW